jgi:DNA primase
MIAASLIEEIRSRADIVEVVGEVVQLKKSGKDYRGLCPFHTEKTPSFYVVPAKSLFHCFGCQESGDVFSFLMKREGLGFTDAVRQVAGRYGIEVPQHDDAQAPDPFRALHEALAFAADHFRRNLRDEQRGAAARRYMESRGLSMAVADRFEIGCAIDEWRDLREAAHRHGIADDVLLEAGLIKVGERTDEPYDRFRARLIFPILDLGGRTIAFGGRLIGAGGTGAPKYLNSPETPVYHKGHVLYGLNWARTAIRRDGTALLVEGQMDCIALAGRGAENVVAPLGTAMTAEQASLLARYASRAILLYDSDAAGLKATFRTADALLRAGVHPLVATLPPGEDPDSLIRAGGLEALKPLVEGASDVLERKIRMLEERNFFDDIEGIRRALDRLLPTVRAAIDPALRDIYVSRVAERTGVRPETIEREASEAAAPGGGAGRAAPPRPRADAAPPPRKEPARALSRSAERLLLLLLLRDPGRVESAAGRVAPEELTGAAERAIYEALLAGAPDGWEETLDAAARRRVEELRADRIEMSDADANFADAVAGIKLEQLHLRFEQAQRSLDAAAGDDRWALLEEVRALRGQIDGLHSRLGKSGRWRRLGRPQSGGP